MHDSPDEADALHQAQMEQERRQAEEAELERNRIEQAYAEAYEKGYREGFDQGDQDARKELIVSRERLDELTLGLEKTVAEGLDAVEEMAVAVVFEAICKILGDTLITPEGVAAQVRNVLSQVCARETLRIRLHPDDLELVKDKEVFGASINGTAVSWIGDDLLTLGSCVVETSGGEFEARLDAQVEQMKAALMAARRSSLMASVNP